MNDPEQLHTRIPRPGDVIADKYRIDRKLGDGGMGTVFCATHLMTGRRFALKWMNAAVEDDDAGRERFIREFQTAGSIMHANVAAVLDVGMQGTSLFIIMEYLEGESLAERIARRPMQATECVPILIEAMRGVAAAHSHDIIHRDLKPENIFICKSPGRPHLEIKVLDFGIVKAVNARADVLPTITQRGIAVGTPPYMAPEQVLALPTIDRRADIYAFGVILYEALSGRLPYAPLTGMRLLQRIVEGTPPPLSQVMPNLPHGLDAVVMRALARNPADRYPSLHAFSDRLLPWAGGVRRITPGKPEELGRFVPPPEPTPLTAADLPKPKPPAQPAQRNDSAIWHMPTQRFKLSELPKPERARRRRKIENGLAVAAVVTLLGSLAWPLLHEREGEGEGQGDDEIAVDPPPLTPLHAPVASPPSAVPAAPVLTPTRSNELTPAAAIPTDGEADVNKPKEPREEEAIAPVPVAPPPAVLRQPKPMGPARARKSPAASERAAAEEPTLRATPRDSAAAPTSGETKPRPARKTSGVSLSDF